MKNGVRSRELEQVHSIGQLERVVFRQGAASLPLMLLLVRVALVVAGAASSVPPDPGLDAAARQKHKRYSGTDASRHLPHPWAAPKASGLSLVAVDGRRLQSSSPTIVGSVSSSTHMNMNLVRGCL
jgi:hypothetical protein